MIIFNDIKKIYGKNVAVNIQKLSLSENNIYGLIGPNGSGKTTTIRMLVGLLKPSFGNILINNSDIHSDIEIKTKLGYVPDNPNLYENLTGREFVEFICNLYYMDDNTNIDYFLDLFDISDKADTLISSYSKGMKQKISIIATLIHNPQILILDEPFTGLDPITIKKLKDYLKEFAKKNNNIVILSTHDLDVASNLCTDIIIIKNGNIIFNDNIKNLTIDSSLEDKFIEIIK
ncbi:ABC transporter ATP-binding protein [Clostridium cibarium]|uniref:ABC transporter ATP-binding protein n=1 Tax=Clostridium cibarium TaxID=2762247 RepID=A0ABR8PZ75_9CLOT|nr:ABC transporter ATP-binding protein [Clostridium cibarium]MBD7913470.1 ABC transporter ATP-binding protein [Clostridium cibarium]